MIFLIITFIYNYLEWQYILLYYVATMYIISAQRRAESQTLFPCLYTYIIASDNHKHLTFRENNKKILPHIIFTRNSNVGNEQRSLSLFVK